MIKKVLFSLLVMGTTVIAPSAMAQKLEDVNRDFPTSTPIKKVEAFTLNNLQRVGWYVVKDNLFIYMNMADTTNLCTAIDFKSGQKVAGFIKKEKTESAIESIMMYGKDSLMAMNKKIVNTYSIKDLMAGSVKPSTINRPDTIIGLVYAKIDDKTIMGAGSGRTNAEKKRYYKVTNDKCTQFLDINPNHFNVVLVDPNGKKYEPKAEDYYSLFAPNSKTGLVAMATRNGRILEVINPKTMKVERSKMYNPATIHVEMLPSGKGMGKLYTVGTESFGALACDENYIYVVMNEKGSEPKTVNYSLLIFDWNLKPIKKHDIMKGKEYASFTFSADMNHLFYLEKSGSEYVLNQFAIEK